LEFQPWVFIASKPDTGGDSTNGRKAFGGDEFSFGVAQCIEHTIECLRHDGKFSRRNRFDTSGPISGGDPFGHTLEQRQRP
jgi:hypothetical protein